MIANTPNINILCINGGSSSVKFGLFTEVDGQLTDIFRDNLSKVTPDSAAKTISEIAAKKFTEKVKLISHRFVHGGSQFAHPVEIDDKVLSEITKLSTLAPLHMPVELDLYARIRAAFPEAKHIACFDTEFHHDMPARAQTIALPQSLRGSELRRFGFHGLSYDYVTRELPRVESSKARQNRVIAAHLGSGSSLAAILAGKCIDTTMGFSPLGGIMMGSRLGDMDPGLLIYLLRSKDLNLDQLEKILISESGLKGVGGTSDMRELLRLRSAGDTNAALAVEMFVYQIQKQIGAYFAALGGLDTLVFTGGIGENAAKIRELICRGLSPLGVLIDDTRNQDSISVISSNSSNVTVRVMRTDEELMLATKAIQYCPQL